MRFGRSSEFPVALVMPWLIANPVSGDWKIIERFPFLVGGGNEESPYDFLVPGPAGQLCHLDKTRGGLKLRFAESFQAAEAELNGGRTGMETVLKDGEGHALVSGTRLLFFAFLENPQEWVAQNIPFSLYLPGGSGQAEGPYSAAEVARKLGQSGRADATIWLAGGASFRGSHLAALFHSVESAPAQAAAPAPLPGDGDFHCPHCGELFADRDVLAVAVHEELRGDDLLRDQMLRFKPEKFDGFSRPLDAYGYPCPDLACPHCHQKLPPEFLKREPFVLRWGDGSEREGKSTAIISLVGGQRAGKSYFLAVQADRLPSVLAEKTSLRWENHDPEGNMNLENYKDRILGARSPEEAAIEKTVIGGITYREVHKGGREIPMPVPFHYRVCRDGNRYPLTCTFYDNAGEHFTPTEPVEKNPGSLHVARAEAIMFLFDPLQSPKFVRVMSDLKVPDPQLNQPMPDLQEVILAEMKTRIRRVKNPGPSGKLEVPLAFIVGKYDAWGEMIAEGERGVDTEILREGRLCLETLAKNSHLAKEAVKHYAPAIIRNVEALASKVMFFPVSTFGHHAVQTANGKGFAPDPRKIKPVLIEAPFLWILSELRPDLLATC